MILLLFFIPFFCVGQSKAEFKFSEELYIKTLNDLNVNFHFEFKSLWNEKLEADNSYRNYELFPKRIADIVDKFQIEELNLKLTQGNWRYDSWGTPILSAPSGAELSAIFKSELSADVIEKNWLQSSRAISGLFGLSINLNDSPNTIAPNNLTTQRYASIPNEIVCTENLTPWIKLLPCANKGLAKLFRKPHKLFESHFFSISLLFKKTCQDGSNCLNRVLELKQTLSLVYNTELFLGQSLNDQTVWTLMTVFSQRLDNICPIADISNVYMDFGSNGASNVAPSQKLTPEISFYDLKNIFNQTKEFNPTIIIKKNLNSINNILSTHRYITDVNDRNFGLKSLITNKHEKRLSIIYTETIPWYFKVYISSLVVLIENESTKILPESIHFVPGLDRKRPHHIEIKLNLKPKSQYSIYFKVECAYLKWDEYPPDVNHGFYINPAQITIDMKANDLLLENPSLLRSSFFNTYSTIYDSIQSPLNVDNKDKLNLNIYTESLLMNLPTPDFSMPYNVICLTCTAVAIAFGSIHNFTTRKFKFLESKTFKQKLIDLIFSKLFFRKKNN